MVQPEQRVLRVGVAPQAPQAPQEQKVQQALLEQQAHRVPQDYQAVQAA